MDSEKIIKIWNKFLYARDLESMKIMASGLSNEQKIKINILSDDGYKCKLKLKQSQIDFLRENYGKEKSPKAFLLFPLIQKSEKTFKGSTSFLYPLFMLELDKEKIKQQDVIEIEYRQAGHLKPLSLSFRGMLDVDTSEIGNDLSISDFIINLTESKSEEFSGLIDDLREHIKNNMSAGSTLAAFADMIVCPFQENTFSGFIKNEFDFISKQDIAKKYPLIESYLTKKSANKTEGNGFKPVYGLYENTHPLGKGQIQAIDQIQNTKLIAVQGAPGTGKTTLFKSIIANRIVERAIELINGINKNRSVLVVSTANTAVDNVIDDLRSDAKLGDVAWLHIRSAAKAKLDSELARIGTLIAELKASDYNSDDHESITKKIKLIKAKIDDDFHNFLSLNEAIQPIIEAVTNNCIELYYESEIIRKLSNDLIEMNYYKFPHSLRKLFSNNIKKQILRINQEHKNTLNVFDIDQINETVLSELAIVETLARLGFGHNEQKLLCSRNEIQNIKIQNNPIKILGLINNSADQISVYVTKYKGSQYIDYYRKNFIKENRELFESACQYLYQCMIRDQDELILALESWEKIISGDGKAHQIWEGNYSQFYQLISLAYPVMASTLASAHKLAIKKFKIIAEEKPFDLCLCDEAGMISAHDLIPVLSRCNAAVIVGDPLQLEPIRNLSEPSINELQDELFDNESDFFQYNPESVTAYHRAAGCSTGAFNDIGDGILLDEHRRSQKPIADLFIDIAGYKGVSIKTEEPEKRILQAYKNMNEQPLIFYSVDGQPGPLKNTNVDEILAIGQLLDKLKSCGYDLEQDVGIVTPYNYQKRLLIKRYGKRLLHEYKNEKIGTVHKFQGAEFPVIIYSPVIFESWQHAKFQNDKPNMLNVAISRAKQQFIVVGNYNRLIKAGSYLKKMAETVAGYNLIRMERYTERAEELEKKKKYSEIIKDCRHIKIYKEAFNRANNRVIVVTPWIRSSISDWQHKVEPIKNASKRGVEVKIYYGWKNIQHGISDDGDPEIINELRDILGDNLVRLKHGTHEKIIIIDDRAAIIGSWNWLSHNYYGSCAKDDNTSKMAIRNETSIVIKDSTQINHLKDVTINK